MFFVSDLQSPFPIGIDDPSGKFIGSAFRIQDTNGFVKFVRICSKYRIQYDPDLILPPTNHKKGGFLFPWSAHAASRTITDKYRVPGPEKTFRDPSNSYSYAVWPHRNMRCSDVWWSIVWVCWKKGSVVRRPVFSRIRRPQTDGKWHFRVPPKKDGD